MNAQRRLPSESRRNRRGTRPFRLARRAYALAPTRPPCRPAITGGTRICNPSSYSAARAVSVGRNESRHDPQRFTVRRTRVVEERAAGTTAGPVARRTADGSAERPYLILVSVLHGEY